MKASYSIEDMGKRLLLRGQSLNIQDFVALGKTWDKRGLTVMLPGVARALGAMMAVAAKDEVEQWEAEVRELAKQRAGGDPELEWFYGPDAGNSSLTIFSVLSTHHHLLPADFRPYPPSDPSDFGRCLRLLNAVPAWCARLSEVVERHPAWKPLVEHWDELEELWLEESPSGECPKLYDRMQELADRKRSRG